MKQTREEQLEKKREYSKKYYIRNKEKIDLKNREYFINNKEKIKQYNKGWNKQYFQKNKDKFRKYAKQHHRDIRKKLINLMGGKCVRCGFCDERALQIDHINGGGYKERKGSSSQNFNRRAIRSIESKEGKFQLLCANCNWIKRHENNENRNSG